MMVAKGFAALALAFALAVIAVVGLGSCSGPSAPTSTPSLVQPSNQQESPAALKAQFEQAVKKNPRDQYAWYNLAVLAASEKDPNTAATDFKRAIAIQADFESALYNLGVMRSRQRDYQAAATMLGRAAASNPKDANAQFELGLALANLHTEAADKKAKAAFAAARNINPKLFAGQLYGSAGTTSTTRGR